jgi:hypothetical protein
MQFYTVDLSQTKRTHPECLFCSGVVPPFLRPVLDEKQPMPHRHNHTFHTQLALIQICSKGGVKNQGPRERGTKRTGFIVGWLDHLNMRDNTY